MDKKSANDLLQLYDELTEGNLGLAFDIIERIMIREGFEDEFIKETKPDRLSVI